MSSKPPLPSLVPQTDFRAPGLVKGMDSVEVLAIRRSPSDEFVRAKVRVKEGDFAGRVFITRQPKTEDSYSPADFSAAEIASMKEQDEKRDRSLSPLAAVIAEVEAGGVHPVEPIQLVESQPYRSVAPFLKRTR